MDIPVNIKHVQQQIGSLVWEVWAKDALLNNPPALREYLTRLEAQAEASQPTPLNQHRPKRQEGA